MVDKNFYDCMRSGIDPRKEMGLTKNEFIHMFYEFLIRYNFIGESTCIGWTSIEKHPDKEGEYLLCDSEDGFMFIAAYDKYGGFIDEMGFSVKNMLHNFTHWMPLPKPPIV